MIQLSRFHKGKNISRQVSIRDQGIVFCLRLNIYVHNELISKEDLVENPLQISKYFCSIFDFISFAKNFNNHLYEVGSIKFFQGCFADNLRMCEGRFYIHFNLVSVWFTKKWQESWRHCAAVRMYLIRNSKFVMSDFSSKENVPLRLWLIAMLEPRIQNDNPITWSSNG